MAAVEWVSCGAQAVSLDGDEKRAETVLEWVSDEDAKKDGLSLQDLHQVNQVLFNIAKYLGLKLTWKSEGNQFRLVFAQ